jgi:hypothetical protein
MRMLVRVLLFVSLSLGCGGVNSKMNKTLDSTYIGMTVEEFKQKTPKATLVQMMENYVCYKYAISRAKFGEPGGYEYSTRFFYFRDNKLYRIDEGAKATDLKIEIEKTEHKD